MANPTNYAGSGYWAGNPTQDQINVSLANIRNGLIGTAHNNVRNAGTTPIALMMYFSSPGGQNLAQATGDWQLACNAAPVNGGATVAAATRACRTQPAFEDVQSTGDQVTSTNGAESAPTTNSEAGDLLTEDLTGPGPKIGFSLFFKYAVSKPDGFKQDFVVKMTGKGWTVLALSGSALTWQFWGKPPQKAPDSLQEESASRETNDTVSTNQDDISAALNYCLQQSDMPAGETWTITQMGA